MNEPQWLMAGLDPTVATVLARLRAEAPWHRLAEEFELHLGSGNHSPKARAVLGAACGLSPGIVQRYVATLQRVRSIAAAERLPVGTLLIGGFNAVEAACRLWDRARDDGLEAFERLAEGRMGLEEIRRQIAEAGPGLTERSAGAAARGAMVHRRAAGADEVEAALKADAGRLFGAGALVRRRPALRHFRRAGFEVLGADGGMLAGLDVLAPQVGQQRDDLELALGPSSLLSTYLPRFYWIVAPGSDPAVGARAVETLEAFGFAWFGVMTVSLESGVRTLRPAEGPPVPDRTGLYDGLKARLAVKRRRAS